ncbi:DUF1385 domain-containing protein [bacterium]|nr:DUF1385 domain-containing protein [bacterium]
MSNDNDKKRSEATQPINDTDRHSMSAELAMGGQAIIEGVMMRSPHRIAMAVRTPEGDIAVESRPHVPYSKRNKFLGWPIVRGAVSMVEALVIGIGALNWSAEHAMPPEEKKKVEGWKKNLGMGFSIFMGLALGLLLFMLIPYWFARAMGDIAKNQLTFHLLAGALRICLLLGYMILISFWKDIRRIFQYHGSEHKSIYAYEKTGSLDVASAMAQTRFHPRCGTSFLLIVALSAIAFFAIVDTIIVAFFGQYPGAFTRFLVHLPLVPIVAGLSYEILKFSGKRTDNPLVKLLIAPGLWLQRITTQEPDPEMCEVALTALREALPKEEPIEESAVAA